MMAQDSSREARTSAPVHAARTTTSPAAGAVVQLKKAAGAAGFDKGSAMLSPDAGALSATAAQGVQGGGQPLPHHDRLQAAFGHHDLGGVQAHVGGRAAAAATELGAQAYATGNQVAFANSPDVHTAAHEAAHVVQQRGGVQLKGVAGQPGDAYEAHADAVADRVAAGGSAEGLLDARAGSGNGAARTGDAVQFLGHELNKPLPAGAEAPAQGDHADQRKYSVEQYIAMWEKDRGRKMTPEEQATLARGCIGITALNVEAVNPPLDHAFATFDQAMALVKEWNAFIEAHKNETTQDGRKTGDLKAYLFAKLFWSNQSPDAEARKKPDDTAYKADPTTGRVDMTGYKYRAQPGYVNFDYGFWDDDSQCFWHANHCQPGMVVYQSTKEKFSKGYIDFDRIIFCAAMGSKYNPAAAARAHG